MLSINNVLNRRSFLAGAAAFGSTAALAGCSSGGSDGGSADDGKTFPVINPARGDIIAEVADLSRAEVARAIEVVEFAIGIPHLLKGEVTENVGTHVDSHSLRQPLGVVAEGAAYVDAFEYFVVAGVGGAQVGGHGFGVVEVGY